MVGAADYLYEASLAGKPILLAGAENSANGISWLILVIGSNEKCEDRLSHEMCIRDSMCVDKKMRNIVLHDSNHRPSGSCLLYTSRCV